MIPPCLSPLGLVGFFPLVFRLPHTMIFPENRVDIEEGEITEVKKKQRKIEVMIFFLLCEGKG